MRDADQTESGAVIGGRKISNLKYADDTSLCGKSPQEIYNVVHKANYAGKIGVLKLNARKTKMMVVGDANANVSIDVDKRWQLLRIHHSKSRTGQYIYHGTGYNFER